MKFSFLKCAVVICLAICFLTAAAQSEYSLALGDDFIVAAKGENMQEICKLTGESKENISAEFSKGGLLALAVTKDADTQIKLFSFADNFSANVYDISNLTEDALGEYAESLAEKSGGEYETTTNNGRLFIVLSQTLADSGGEYTCTQYLTVCSGKVYCLTCYNSGTETSAAAASAFRALTVSGTDVSVKDKSNNTEYILIIAGILVFALVAGWMIVGIVKDSNGLKGETEDTQGKE